MDTAGSTKSRGESVKVLLVLLVQSRLYWFNHVTGWGCVSTAGLTKSQDEIVWVLLFQPRHRVNVYGYNGDRRQTVRTSRVCMPPPTWFFTCVVAR